MALLGIGLLFALYTLFHAFTYAPLSGASRLTLSIWSSILMMLFAFDHIYRVAQYEYIEFTADPAYAFFIGFQYFLLGVSGIYIVQNVLLLLGFLPGKGTFFNAEYFRDLKKLKADHIRRYSDRQVNVWYALFCVLFTGAIFAINYVWQVVPRHVAIWSIFTVFPFLLEVYEALLKKQSTS